MRMEQMVMDEVLRLHRIKGQSRRDYVSGANVAADRMLDLPMIKDKILRAAVKTAHEVRAVD